MKPFAILLLVLFSFSLLANTPTEIPPQSKACKMLAAEISKSGKLTTDEDFQRIGTRLPKDVYARARKFMDNGEKLNAVREIRTCLNTGLLETKRIVELLP